MCSLHLKVSLVEIIIHCMHGHGSKNAWKLYVHHFGVQILYIFFLNLPLFAETYRLTTNLPLHGILSRQILWDQAWLEIGGLKMRFKMFFYEEAMKSVSLYCVLCKLISWNLIITPIHPHICQSLNSHDHQIHYKLLNFTTISTFSPPDKDRGRNW